MLVANSFDLWQMDAFFSAAEEVQQSADILESAYRTWVKERRERALSIDLEELRRELQTALGTAKWQLDEFERAVRLSYGNCRDQNRMTRHQQFVVAIESQISRVEDALRESLEEEGKPSFQWVNLDEDERDDLAMFLSGSSGTTTKSIRDESVKHSSSTEMEISYKRKHFDYGACTSSSSTEVNNHVEGLNSYRDDVVIDMGPPNCTVEFGAREALGTKGDANLEAERAATMKRTWGLPSSGALKIMIPDEGAHMKMSMPPVDETPKEKGYKASNYLYLRGFNGITRIINNSCGLKSKLQSPLRMKLSSSLQLIVVLVLSFFLLVPYFLHSS